MFYFWRFFDNYYNSPNFKTNKKEKMFFFHFLKKVVFVFSKLFSKDIVFFNLNLQKIWMIDSTISFEFI